MRGALFLTLLAALHAVAQPPSPQPTFRAGTELVQVSVVAQDQNGKPAAGLHREDFQIFDNGAPQEIRLFIADRPVPASTGMTTPGAFSNRLAAEGAGGYSAILFDNLLIDPGNRNFVYTARARQKALQALQAIPRGDKIAIYSLWCQFQVVREFTSDRDSLLRQLEAFSPAPGSCIDPSSGETQRRASGTIITSGPPRADGTPSVGQVPMAPPLPPPGAHDNGAAGTASAILADIADRQMKQLADHLAGIPGRKNLIWLTINFRMTPPNMQRFLNAQVAIYPVDTLGSTIALKTEKDAHAAPLRALAARSGGVAYVDRDDLETAIREALNDGHVSYTLGYYQPATDAGLPVHQIMVRVNRPGIALRYRSGYSIDPHPPASADPVHDFIQAMNRQVNATEIPISASATRSEDRLDLSMSFDISGLGLQLRDELWKGKAEVLARFLTANGVQSGDTVADTLTLTLRPASYVSMLETGAPYHKEMTIPPTAVELDLLVGSVDTGKIGTLKIPVAEIPSAPLAK